MNKILFLCTGNYYRSRTAEELFNYYAEKEGLSCRAYSMGLAEDITASRNPGPMSIHAVRYLDSIQVPIQGRFRMPESLTLSQAAQYDAIIALDDEEHRPMVEARFPELENTVIYWNVHDLHLTEPEQALNSIHTQIIQFLRQMEKALV